MRFEVFDWISYHAVRTPEKSALIDLASERTISYARMHDRVGHLAGFMRERFGVGPGDRVGLLAENSSDYLEVQCACFRIGAIFLPLNWRLAVPELDYILGHAKPTLMIHDRGFSETIAALRQSGGVAHAIETAADGGPSAYEDALVVGPFVTEITPQEMSDISTVMYTSGTTGRPKGAKITHGMLFINAVNIGMPHRISAESKALTVLPLFHTGGLNCYSNPVLHAGGTNAIARRFDPASCLAMLKDPEAGITNFLGVPATYQFMAQQPGFAEADFSHVALFGIGAAPSSTALIAAWSARGAPLTQVYGMTETAPAVLSLDSADAARKIGSAGKPLLYTSVRVVNEAGRLAETGETGELWVRGPNVTPGYWNAPRETTAAFDGDWFKTGDAVYVDDEGYYFVVDRWKDMYISGGENVYPAEVENVLYQLEEIAEVAIVGVPDDRWGEAGCAIVVLRDAASLDACALREHCRGRLAGFKQPLHVVFIDALPRNATGKVLKHELRRRIAAGEITL